MQQTVPDFLPTENFSRFLRASWRLISAILCLSFFVRLIFLKLYPLHFTQFNDSVSRYIPTALNILNGNGFSLDTTAPFRVSEACVPIYPLFLAIIYAIFGIDNYAVIYVQILLDLISTILVSFISYSLSPSEKKKSSAIFAMLIYGVFSWFTFFWTTRILTETLTLFFVISTLAFCAKAWQNPQKSWRFYGLAGFFCGLAIITRPDSVLTFGAIGLFLGSRFLFEKFRDVSLNILSFSLATALALAPWTIHNFYYLDKFQPLASEWAWAQPEEHFMPTGYLLWIKTWMVDETYFWHVFNQAFLPKIFAFETEKMPPEMFASPEEREKIVLLMQKYNETLLFTPEIDAEFRLIAEARIRENPFRYYILLPVQRTFSLWLTGFSTNQKTSISLILRTLSVLPIHLGGFFAFAFLVRRNPLAWLLLIGIFVRTVFLAFHYAPETRYLVMVYPSMIAACGVSLAFMWHWFLSYWTERFYAKF